MDITVRLVDLTVMQPRLLWEDISAAVVATLSGAGMHAPFSLELAVRDVPGFGSGALRLEIDPGGVSTDHVLGCGEPRSRPD